MSHHHVKSYPRSRIYILLFLLYETLVLSVLIYTIVTSAPYTTRTLRAFWIIAPTFFFGIIQAIEALVLIQYARTNHPELSLNHFESFTLWAFVFSSEDGNDVHLRELKQNLRTTWLLFIAPIPLLAMTIYTLSLT